MCRRGSRQAVKLLREYVEGKRPCSDADRLKAAMYLLDRAEAKPTLDAGGGMFQGARIVVHTGFPDAPGLAAPTVDAVPVNGHDKATSE